MNVLVTRRVLTDSVATRVIVALMQNVLLLIIDLSALAFLDMMGIQILDAEQVTNYTYYV